MKDSSVDLPRPDILTRKKKLSNENAPERSKKLSQSHIDYLVDEDTLKQSVGRSLAERAAHFMSIFPAKKLSKARLQSIYKKAKIKFKKVKMIKVLNSR